MDTYRDQIFTIRLGTLYGAGVFLVAPVSKLQSL